jgi:methanol---5-hydroxybenzimidazolylcobamide Co-methyltransferase
MPEFTSLAIQSLDAFLYGQCPKPLTLKNGLTIGGGTVYPELNFTLPDMIIDPETMPVVRSQYRQMINEATTRAVELGAPGLVVEFELLPDLTLTPEWGADITTILREALDRAQADHDLPVALRVTPNDIREFARPPVLRSGEFVEKMYRSFALCAEAGADLLSIESTGGKEIHDDAILQGDLPAALFALGILACRDMTYLWTNIYAIARQNGSIAAGDTACGFANTAMVLAEQRFIPRVWAAVIRVMCVTRSLAAYEAGAVGPSKDCAYEGPYLKAITGYPISMEGAEAACAHLSPVGNITKAVPDLWSNESVNNVRLLGAMAPTVSLEQLVYATRLMNTAAGHGAQAARTLRDWWVESDALRDPQAYVLQPGVVLELSKEIIAEPTPYLRTRRAALATLALLRKAAASGDLTLSRLEQRWLDKLSAQADGLPEDEDALIGLVLPGIDRSKIRFEEYGLVV